MDKKDEASLDEQELVNLLYPEYSEWKRTKARKKHIDEFKQTINPGEVYFKRIIGTGFSSNLKLSNESFKKLKSVIFNFNSILKDKL